MSMQVEGSNNDSNPKRYTMADLNITEGSPAASIFNRIDKQDGHEDGFLTEDQYREYVAEIDKFKIDLGDKKILKNESKNKSNAFIRFVARFSYFLIHGGKLYENTHSDNEKEFQKENTNPKLAEMEKK